MLEWFYNGKGKGLILLVVINVLIVAFGALLSLIGFLPKFIADLYWNIFVNSLLQLILFIGIIWWLGTKASKNNLNNLEAEIEEIKLRNSR